MPGSCSKKPLFEETISAGERRDEFLLPAGLRSSGKKKKKGSRVAHPFQRPRKRKGKE